MLLSWSCRLVVEVVVVVGGVFFSLWPFLTTHKHTHTNTIGSFESKNRWKGKAAEPWGGER